MLIFTGCTKKIVDLTCSIHGSITDKNTNEAISGALVALPPSGKSITTGSDGLYEFTKLDANTYTIKVSAPGYSSESIEVTLKPMDEIKRDVHLISASPILSVSVDKLNFDVNTSTLSFSITNTGQNSLDWSISDKADWLTYKPSSGNTTTTATAVTVEVSRNGLAGGTYSETLAITSNGGDKTIPVTLEVSKVSTQLKITPEQLVFGTSESVLDLTLENVGSTAYVDYTASASNDWIKLSNTSGTVTNKGTIKVSVDRGNIAAGKHEGNVTIKVGDQPTVIPVTMEKIADAKPIVNMSEAGTITYCSIEFKGAVVDIGSAKVTSHGFCWNTTGNPNADESSKCTLGDCSEPKSMVYVAQNLEPGTKYYVKAYAENSVGITYSTERSFTTNEMPTIPAVTTGEVSKIEAQSAYVVGTITSLGNVDKVTQYGHVWSSENSSPTVSLTTKTELGEKSVSGSFSSDATGLYPNTKYYIRAYATNSEGTGYGETKTFTTPISSPIVVTNDASDITKNSAVMNANITHNGGGTISAYGFLYGTSAASLTIEVKKTENKEGAFSSTISGLSSNVTYYYKAFATNENGTSYGEVVSFTTSSVNGGGTGDDFGNEQW